MNTMAAETKTVPSLHVVQIRYQGSERALPGSDPIDAYAASAAYTLLGDATIVEPGFPEERRDEEPTVNLGLIGGEIAEASRFVRVGYRPRRQRQRLLATQVQWRAAGGEHGEIGHGVDRFERMRQRHVGDFRSRRR